MARPKLNQAGFTLVEVLITTLIFGLLVSVLGPMVVQTQRTWNSTRGQVEIESNLRQGLDYVAREIRHAEPGKVTESANSVEYQNAVTGQVYEISVAGGRLTQKTVSTGRIQELSSPEVNITALDVSPVTVDAGTAYNVTIRGRVGTGTSESQLTTQVIPRKGLQLR